MSSRAVTILLSVAAALLLATLLPVLGGMRGPSNDVGYQPVQPIAFSHRLHAGELGVSCLYCHGDAEKSRHAGVPDAATCLNCHKFVPAPIGAVRAEADAAAAEGRPPRRIVSPEIRKLYDALGLDENLNPDPKKTPKPIEWQRVHRLPDFVWFDHRPHVAAGVDCAQCHGAVETMERVRQDKDLSMGFCLDCHRTWNKPIGPAVESMAHPPVAGPSTDCSICHF